MSARPTTLVISNIAWSFVWQRHQTLASLFARESDVIFCEIPGIRRVGLRDISRVWARLLALGRAGPRREPLPAGIRVLRPFVLPATNRVFHACNRIAIARCLRREPSLRAGVDLILNYSPSRTALELIGRVPHRRLVYDCTDDWLAVRGIPSCLPDDERALLARADLTLVPSRRLEALKGPLARRLERVPHGAFVERFQVEPKAHPADGALTVLYYGHLHAQHLDFAAITALAGARPQWRVVLVGPVKTPHVFPQNVELPGQQPHESLRNFVQDADVLLLPYALSDYTRSVLPAKTYECLATGRPMVATPLPELVALGGGLIEFGSTADELVAAIERAVAGDSAVVRERKKALAATNTWEARYTQIRQLLAALESPAARG
jgi:glycosyltransferase involved in cell wall biosynthesis